MLSINTIREFEAALMLPILGLDDVDAYYSHNNCREALQVRGARVLPCVRVCLLVAAFTQPTPFPGTPRPTPPCPAPFAPPTAHGVVSPFSTLSTL